MTGAVGRTVDGDLSAARDAPIDLAVHSRGDGVAGPGDPKSRVAADGAVVGDVPTAGDGATELEACATTDRDVPTAGDLGVHVAGDLADGEGAAAGNFEVRILRYRSERSLAGAREVPDQGLDTTGHQFRPNGRAEVELGVQVVRDADGTDQSADLDVGRLGDDQHELDGAVQVDLAAVEDDRPAAPPGRGEAAERATRDRDVASHEDVASEGVVGTSRLEGDLPLQREGGARHVALDCGEHLLVTVVADEAGLGDVHRNDGHLREHAPEDDLSDVATEALVHPPLARGQVVAVGQSGAGTEELLNLCTHWG